MPLSKKVPTLNVCQVRRAPDHGDASQESPFLPRPPGLGVGSEEQAEQREKKSFILRLWLLLSTQVSKGSDRVYSLRTTGPAG